MQPPSDSSIEGVWQLVRAELDGEPAHELVTQHTVLELTAGNYSVRYDGVVADRGSFELGGNPAQKTIILRGSDGPNAGQTIPGIFQLVGDRLRICYGLNGHAPAEFATAKGQRRYLAVYRRSRVSRHQK